jgi:hypothetical protein
VYTEDGTQTKIAYNNPQYLKSRHNIEGEDAVLEKITNALDAITTKAISSN